jgi:hypothetical protein
MSWLHVVRIILSATLLVLWLRTRSPIRWAAIAIAGLNIAFVMLVDLDIFNAISNADLNTISNVIVDLSLLLLIELRPRGKQA